MAVTCKSVTTGRGTFRLTADWSLTEGATLSLIGPSGSGKSLFLGALAGFDPILSGSVSVAGQDITSLAPADRPITLMFQDHNLFPHLSAAQNVGLGLDPSLRLTREQLRDVDAALERVGLSGMGARFPAELSGGQQSRVALARALIRKRPLLLLDEPFSALGPRMRREMLDLVKDTATAAKMTVILVTHTPEDARIAGFTSVVSDGAVAPPVATEALFADPPPALRDYL